MSNIYRLRLAADNVWTGQAILDIKVAALLRAVADAHERQPGEPDDGPCPCPEMPAALALADAILGKTDKWIARDEDERRAAYDD